jgi:hypothetical protein
MATSPTTEPNASSEPATAPSSSASPQTYSVLATSCSPSLAAAAIRRDPRYLEARAKLARGESLGSHKP